MRGHLQCEGQISFNFDNAMNYYQKKNWLFVFLLISIPVVFLVVFRVFKCHLSCYSVIWILWSLFKCLAFFCNCLMPRLHMQVWQPGTGRKACIKLFLCCEGHAIYSLGTPLLVNYRVVSVCISMLNLIKHQFKLELTPNHLSMS